MMTKRSISKLKENRNMSKEETDNLDCTIHIRNVTADMLREIAREHNLSTFDSVVKGLIGTYKKMQKLQEQQKQ